MLSSYATICTRPVYFRVVLFSAPYFGLFIKFAFYRSKKIPSCRLSTTTSTDASGMSVTSGATAPAPPNLLMLNTCSKLFRRISILGFAIREKY